MTPVTQSPPMAPLPPQAHQLLDQMNDIIAPPAVGWWPPAPGWWILTALLILLLAWVIQHWRLHRRRNMYRKAALTALDNLKDCPDKALPAEINRLLKRTALSAYPDCSFTINRAFGEAWVVWLNQCCTKPVIGGEAALAIAFGGYQPDIEYLRDELTEIARRWIQSHRLSAKPGGTNV